jgi:hypothetical protein
MFVRYSLLELRQYIGVAPYILELWWTYWSCDLKLGSATPICPLSLNNYNNESHEIELKINITYKYNFHCRSSIS